MEIYLSQSLGGAGNGRECIFRNMYFVFNRIYFVSSWNILEIFPYSHIISHAFTFIAANLKHAPTHTYSHIQLQLYWTQLKQNMSYICFYLNLNTTLEISINPNVSTFIATNLKQDSAHIHSTEATPTAYNFHCK